MEQPEFEKEFGGLLRLHSSGVFGGARRGG
jgi:hypothetical protein